MIGWLNGRVIDCTQPGKLLLDVNGVGYELETSLSTFFQLESKKETVGLYVHTVVREDAFLLYGFIDQAERALFRALIKVNGVGPKMAIGILSSVQPDEFIRCIQQKDTAMLVRLPGIGKKTAERLVVEMVDSFNHLFHHLLSTERDHAQTSQTAVSFSNQHEAIGALEALGYTAQQASKAVRHLDDGSKSCEQLIREALQYLSGARV